MEARESARARFRQMPGDNRNAFLTFVSSLMGDRQADWRRLRACRCLHRDFGHDLAAGAVDDLSLLQSCLKSQRRVERYRQRIGPSLRTLGGERGKPGNPVGRTEEKLELFVESHATWRRCGQYRLRIVDLNLLDYARLRNKLQARHALAGNDLNDGLRLTPDTAAQEGLARFRRLFSGDGGTEGPLPCG